MSIRDGQGHSTYPACLNCHRPTPLGQFCDRVCESEYNTNQRTQNTEASQTTSVFIQT